VNALCWSTLTGLAERGCDDLHVFDYGRGSGQASFGMVRYTRHGMTIGKRLWHSNHLGVARLGAALGIRRGRLLSVVSNADLVLDVSGGDSFTDLYGGARFRNIVAPKEIALDLGRRLVMLPQTYGPFRSRSSRDTARRLIERASLAYARDPDSFARLQDLLGGAFDPARHRLGVDLAFGLPVHAPKELEPGVAATLASRDQSPLIGLNVSGLLSNHQQQASSRFSLLGDYRSLMRRLMMRLLDETDARILMVPHVHAPRGHYESDLDASLALRESLPDSYASTVDDRVAVVTEPLDACELKWLISQCDWFCGTRMHATIAAVSSGVPTAALAYSLKTRGVFKTCEAGDSVVDLREQEEDEVLEQLINLWRCREESASQLARSLPRVRAIAAGQLDDIVGSAREDGYAPGAVQC
jgi:polysaccharide pyruvyl transferase WcaK-like protein